jgi:hypothetical protein
MADKHTARSVVRMDHDAETAWIYQHRLAYRSTADIAEMAKRPIIRGENGRFSLDGGLGRNIGTRTVQRRIIEAAQVHTEELAELVPEYRGISLARLDEISRVRTAQITRMLARAGYVYEAGMEWGQVVIDPAAEKVLDAALKGLAWVEERRSKLLGLDAPVEVAVTVEHYDAEARELAAMLDAAAGKKARA